MINMVSLKINDKVAIGLKVELPDSPSLLMIIGQTGFVMCGFLNMDVAEKLNVAAAMVRGVRNFDDMFSELKLKQQHLRLRSRE